METQLSNYVMDNENPLYNFELGLEYEKIGQTSSAISFFLRCAERSHTNDITLTYESLLHMGHLYDIQGRREKTATSCWKKALTLSPLRPEAYYYLSRLSNWNANYDEAYMLTTIALNFCDFNLDTLKNTNYIDPSTYKVNILFDHGLSAWWWGKVDESTNIFTDLYQNHYNEFPSYQQNILSQYLKDKMKVI